MHVLRRVPTFVIAQMFCASHIQWFKQARAGIDVRDLKHHDGSHDDCIPEANFLLRSCAETE